MQHRSLTLLSGPWRRGAGVAMLLVVGAVAAPVTGPGAPRSTIPAELEAIAPVPAPPEADPAKVALGERVFADPHLSADGTRSCETCHEVRSNGAGRRPIDTGVDGAALPFNTPTVFNAALSYRLGWAGTARTLEAQVAGSLDNPQLMGTDIRQVLAHLRAAPESANRFRAVYGHEPDRESLIDAVVTYERSLLTPGSRFDRWLDGDQGALSDTEREGYGLFKSLGCVSCHQGVNIGGNLLEKPGIFARLAGPAPALLRVPSLRNVAVTPPYFHDGSAATLDDAVRKMAAAQLDLALSDDEVGAIVAFLGSLTGTYRGTPVRAVPP